MDGTRIEIPAIHGNIWQNIIAQEVCTTNKDEDYIAMEPSSHIIENYVITRRADGAWRALFRDWIYA